MRAAAASHLPGKNDIGKKIFRIGVGPQLSDKNVEQLIYYENTAQNFFA